MIIRETADAFILTQQHEHARLAGEIARALPEAYWEGEPYKGDVLTAVDQHDRSWIALDDTPLWDDGLGGPYSFMDYPMLPKIRLYSYGLDEIEAMSPYAALLCSLHYASFEPESHYEAWVQFRREEQGRQERIRRQLGGPDEKTVHRHFRLLQLCDNLSLYIGLNEPGTPKTQEHPWFKDGLPHSEEAGVSGGQPLRASWTSPRDIRLEPSPFEADRRVEVKWKAVPKAGIRESGIARAYQDAAWTVQEVVFLGG